VNDEQDGPDPKPGVDPHRQLDDGLRSPHPLPYQPKVIESERAAFPPAVAFMISFVVGIVAAGFLSAFGLRRSDPAVALALSVGLAFFIVAGVLTWKTHTSGWLAGLVVALLLSPLVFFAVCAAALSGL
jgi:peptidoglycan/LPS O-acetylase OafA/YrhL